MKQNCNVPAFLSKLWTLVDDHSTDDLICWNQDGCSFLIFEEQPFSKEILPLYFKHSNMTSFVRQLNMYGFHKVAQVEAGLPRADGHEDSVEFQHPYFQQAQPHLLELIRRKVSVSRNGEDGPSYVSQVLVELGQVKGWQDISDSKLMALRRENESLWREVDSLKQKYQQHHKIIHKIIRFIASTVQSNKIAGFKRKLPLMIDSSGISHSPPKFSRSVSFQDSKAASALHGIQLDFNVSSFYSSGMIISDIADLLDMQQSGGQEMCRSPKADILLEDTFEQTVASPPVPAAELDLSLLEVLAPPEMRENNRNDKCDPLTLIDSSLEAMHSTPPLSPVPALDLLAKLFIPALCSGGCCDVGAQKGRTGLGDEAASETNCQTGVLAWEQSKLGQMVAEQSGAARPEAPVAQLHPINALDCTSQQRGRSEEGQEAEDGSDILPSLLELAEEVCDFEQCPAETLAPL